jgi:hypothetical protein
MRKHRFNFFSLSILLFFSISLSAQPAGPDLTYELVASQKGTETTYKPGSKLFLKYNNDHSAKKCRGIFAGIKDGEIVIMNKRKDTEILILPRDITLLRRIRPGSRLILGGIGTAMVVGGTAGVDNAGSTHASSLRSAGAIAFVGVGVFVLLAIPVTLFVEKVSEKKIVNGWKFEVRKQ